MTRIVQPAEKAGRDCGAPRMNDDDENKPVVCNGNAEGGFAIAAARNPAGADNPISVP